MTNVTPIQKEPATLELLINEAVKMKVEIDARSKTLAELKKNRDAILLQVRDIMDEAGTTTAGTSQGNAIISEKIVASVKDWDLLINFIKENDAFHLLPKSINAAAYREYVNAEEEVPGTEPFTKRDIHVRKR